MYRTYPQPKLSNSENKQRIKNLALCMKINWVEQIPKYTQTPFGNQNKLPYQVAGVLKGRKENKLMKKEARTSSLLAGWIKTPVEVLRHATLTTRQRRITTCLLLLSITELVSLNGT